MRYAAPREPVGRAASRVVAARVAHATLLLPSCQIESEAPAKARQFQSGANQHRA